MKKQKESMENKPLVLIGYFLLLSGAIKLAIGRWNFTTWFFIFAMVIGCYLIFGDKNKMDKKK